MTIDIVTVKIAKHERVPHLEGTSEGEAIHDCKDEKIPRVRYFVVCPKCKRDIKTKKPYSFWCCKCKYCWQTEKCLKLKQNDKIPLSQLSAMSKRYFAYL